MSKIYEALQNVHRQKKHDSMSPPPLPVPFAPLETEGVGMDNEMLSLYKIVDTLLPQGKKIIQFIGTREGEGTSTIIREFARVAANLIGQSVLLLDADRHHPSQNRFFDIEKGLSWVDALKSDLPPGGNELHQIGRSKLFFSPSSNSSASTPEIFDSRFARMCENLKKDFDLVLIDSSPLTLSPDGLAIASKVDGVILVVEAEKTRWQTVKKVRDNIARVGGNILGVALNKRRYYIPQFIYKYL